MKTITLYSYESDNCFYLAGPETRETEKFAKQQWKSIKKQKGKDGNLHHPSNSCKCFTSLNAAKLAAKKDHKSWFFTFSFSITKDVVSKLFDGVYGCDGPKFKIKKVNPLMMRKKTK